MKRFCILTLLFCGLTTMLTLQAQTIIPLERGKVGVRAKNIEDYKNDMKMAERLRDDSLLYVDNLRRAFNALHTDSLAQAERLFNEALKLRPTAPGNHIIRYNLGLVDMARGNNVEAIKKLTDIIKTYPNYFDARLARAEAYLQLGRTNEAIDDAQQLLEKQHLDGMTADIAERARFVRAAARYQLRLYTDAHADLQTIMGDNPQNVNAQVLDALTLQHMGRPKEALNRLNLIVEAHPHHIDAISTRAAVEAELNLTAMARADYDTLIKLQPNESSYYIERAKMLIRLGEKKAARNDLDTAVRLGVPQGMVHLLYQQVR
ncbi:MAG: tetratricopeptide repeat protein [Prevotella sp.]|nr:tetratricopeptide repeat protein [Prevotella sp.]MDY5665882.1 tetratricopeptide repeat protein [Alloprevotella sp.]